MATSDIERILTVFQGMASRDEGVALKYFHPTRYTEHYPLASDGVAGVKEWFEHLPAEKAGLETVRAFQDGSYVFTQTVGPSDVFFDVFRFNDGLIVEHWSFSERVAPPNKSGHTQIDGPTRAKAEDREKNKSRIREYYETVHIAGKHDKIPHYVSSNQVRHEPGVRDGLEAFLADVEVLTQHRTIDEIKLLLGEGDFVFVAAMGTHEGAPCAYIDLYRVEDAKIAEHWGFFENIPPLEKSKNDNGML